MYYDKLKSRLLYGCFFFTRKHWNIKVCFTASLRLLIVLWWLLVTAIRRGHAWHQQGDDRRIWPWNFNHPGNAAQKMVQKVRREAGKVPKKCYVIQMVTSRWWRQRRAGWRFLCLNLLPSISSEAIEPLEEETWNLIFPWPKQCTGR